MFTFFSRSLIRVAMITALTGGGLIIADGASAFSDLGNRSRGEIMGACAGAGGTYNDNGASGFWAEYGCTTAKGKVSCYGHRDGTSTCSGNCEKCADVLPKKGGVVGGAGSAGNPNGTARAHAAPSHKAKPVVAIHHAPLKKFAARSARVH
jgi:hypothetical protein